MNKIHQFFKVFHIHIFKHTQNYCVTGTIFCYSVLRRIKSLLNFYFGIICILLELLNRYSTVFSTDLACTACTAKPTDLAHAKITQAEA